MPAPHVAAVAFVTLALVAAVELGGPDVCEVRGLTDGNVAAAAPPAPLAPSASPTTFSPPPLPPLLPPLVRTGLAWRNGASMAPPAPVRAVAPAPECETLAAGGGGGAPAP